MQLQYFEVKLAIYWEAQVCFGFQHVSTIILGLGLDGCVLNGFFQGLDRTLDRTAVLST